MYKHVNTVYRHTVSCLPGFSSTYVHTLDSSAVIMSHKRGGNKLIRELFAFITRSALEAQQSIFRVIRQRSTNRERGREVRLESWHGSVTPDVWCCRGKSEKTHSKEPKTCRRRGCLTSREWKNTWLSCGVKDGYWEKFCKGNRAAEYR